MGRRAAVLEPSDQEADLLVQRSPWRRRRGPGARDRRARPWSGSLPLQARGPVAAALGAGDRAYWVRDLRAVDPAQRLTLGFTPTGVTVVSGAGRLRLSLTGFGHAGAVARVSAVTPSARANRVTYARSGGLREWYANGPLGLEQGFDVARRPAGSGPLVFSIALGGDLRPTMDGAAVAFSGRDASLLDTDLVAVDAAGRRLPARMTLAGGRLVISVDDHGARYPLHVDPTVQEAELTASDGGGGLGASVAISGTTIVAGAPGHTVDGHAQQGAVYVFTEPASGWADATQTAELTASDGAASDFLGVSVAVDGATVVAGAPGAASGKGAVYVFSEPAGGWSSGTQTATLTASDGAQR